MQARLAGEAIAEGEAARGLGPLGAAAQLVHYYLSDVYHQLRAAIGEPGGRV